MADAQYVRGAHDNRVTALAAVAAGEVWQLKDGRAAVYSGQAAAAANDRVNFTTDGVFTVTKTATMVFLDGGRVYWDHSANKAHYKRVSDRDFYIGRAVGDAASADTTMKVNLNIDPPYDIDLFRDGFQSVLAGTAAAGGFGYPVALGGALIFELSATNEAQKVDALSVDGFAKGANPIIEGAFRILEDGASTTADFNIGLADGTHATDADSIATSVFIHTDSNVVNILAESDDGTTEVAATDTTLDYTLGAALASRVEFWMDCRDPADVQIYVNSALVLTASVFNIDAFTGTAFLLVHLEKTTGTETYKVAVDWLRMRSSEQNGS